MKIRMPKVTVTESEDFSEIKLVVEPLDKGLGTTLGNAMRRMLLSDLPGVAAVGVKIEGVLHEFSTIPGVAEDVVDIILNIKELCFRAETESGLLEEGEEVTLHLKKETPGPVVGGDIDGGGRILVMNPEQVICNLGSPGRLDMEITVGSGRGYRDARENKSAESPIGYIPTDSIFTPVLSASYEVEDARVGQEINYDRLKLRTKTNGTISGKEVVSLAAKILDDHTRLFIELCERIGDMASVLEKAEEEKKDDLSRLPIEEMDFSVRAYNCLKRGGISSFGELVSRTEQELMRLRNFGQNSLFEVKSKLAERGWALSEGEELPLK